MPLLRLAVVLCAGLLLAPAAARAEGFGLPVVEAMAAGVPVVTSDAPALVEVGGDATRASPIGDPAALGAVLREVVADVDALATMRAAGLDRAAQFTWSAVAGRLWQLYARLLAD